MKKLVIAAMILLILIIGLSVADNRLSDVDIGISEDTEIYESYTVYSYTYTKHGGILPFVDISVKGQVYFYRLQSPSLFDEMALPQDFDPKTDIMIGDFSDRHNPFFFGYQAHKLRPYLREAVIKVMLKYDRELDTPFDRTAESLAVEWKCHGWFSFEKSSQDIDFDNAEEAFRELDYIEKAFSNFKDYYLN